jgi:Na+/melibiose symporter-like transporter
VGVLFGLFLAYWLVVAPAHGLSATMALRNLDRPAEEFGGVRGMGTIGWMVAGWLTSIVMLLTGTTDRGKGAEEGFWLAAGLSVVLAVVAATWLPHTPPVAQAGGERRRADLSEAIRVLRRPAVALYLLMAFAVTLTTPYVYQVLPNTLQAWGLPRRWLAPAMSLGQVPEILSLLILPKLLSRFGFVGTMAMGMGAYVIRYGSLVLEPPLWVAVAGIPLHGIGVACFTIAGQMYLDRQAPPDRRAEAQGLNMVVTTGAGALLGSLLAGELVGLLGNDRGAIYWAPFAINLGCLVLWLGMSMRWARNASGGTR